MVIGIMYLHNFTTAPKVPMKALSDICDAVAYVAHDVTDPSILAAAEATPNLLEIQHVTGRWTRYGSLYTCIKLADTFKPDAVFLPDDDEAFSIKTIDTIALWRREWDKRPTLSFQTFLCWENPQQILAQRVSRQWWHCKAVRWTPDLRKAYEGKYAGWCWPSALFRQSKCFCPYPFRHLAYMTAKQRKQRSSPNRTATTKGDWQWWQYEHWRTMRWRDDLTWDEWCKIAGPYITQEQGHASYNTRSNK